MKILFLSFLFILISISSKALDCNFDHADPYSPNIKMPAGKYVGQCLDTQLHRSAKKLAENDNEITVANFQYEDQYYIAHIPKHSVEKVIFDIVHFDTSVPLINAAHTQLRFVLKTGKKIILESQSRSKAYSRVEISDFILSVHGDGPRGVDYSLIEGLNKNYLAVYRLVETKTRALEDKERKINQYKLHLTEDEASQVMLEAVYKSTKTGYLNIYHTLKLNCTTELFKVIDLALQSRYQVKKFNISVLQALDPVEGPALKALIYRNILVRNSKLKTLNEELGI